MTDAFVVPSRSQVAMSVERERDARRHLVLGGPDLAFVVRGTLKAIIN